MELLTAEQMRQRDRWTIEVAGLPGIALMESAGSRVAQLARRLLGEPEDKRVWIFVGKGNNGGDGLVAARHLVKTGVVAETFLVVPEESLRGDAAKNLKIHQSLGLPLQVIRDFRELQLLKKRLPGVDLLIDGILGTGIRGPVTGFLGEVIGFINASKKPILSIDLPSGLDADTGACPGPVVKAQNTITLDLPKLGLFLYPGAEAAGQLWLGEIGIPPGAPLPPERSFLITPRQVAQHLPLRSKVSHKGSWGRVLIIAGSVGMAGAAVLATRGALRSGAGLVTAAVPRAIQPLVASQALEALTRPLPQNRRGSLSKEGAGEILRLAKAADVVALGPGLSRDDETLDLVSVILPRLQVPVVIDADGLNALVAAPKLFQKISAPVLVTPHPGEMARLCKTDGAGVQANRWSLAREKAKEWGVVVVLKGSRTIVAGPRGEAGLNLTGNPGLASGGTGDVLTGVIASLIGQGLTPFWAAIGGVYLQGLAGDQGSRVKGEAGLLAEDVIEFLPQAYEVTMRGEGEPVSILKILD